MKIAHYQYVGYPRSGSTFLHGVFRQHPYLQECIKSLPKEGLYLTESRYKQTFDKFDYSINMHPGVIFPTFGTDDDFFKSADAVTTKFFACVRNPYHMIDSIHMYTSPKKWNELVIAKLSNYSNHISRLQLLLTKPFKIFYFDDLIDNEREFITDVYNWFEIPCEIPVNLDVINRNESSKTYFTGLGRSEFRTVREPVVHYEFSDQDVVNINWNISKFEELVNKNFDHWKR